MAGVINVLRSRFDSLTIEALKMNNLGIGDSKLSAVELKKGDDTAMSIRI